MPSVKQLGKLYKMWKRIYKTFREIKMKTKQQQIQRVLDINTNKYNEFRNEDYSFNLRKLTKVEKDNLLDTRKCIDYVSDLHLFAELDDLDNYIYFIQDDIHNE